MSPPIPDQLPTDAAARSNKRRKAQLACNPCRARKTGCDGHRPCCGSCLMRGWQERCSYQEAALHPSTPAPTLISLDKRLRRLEQTAQALPLLASSETRAIDPRDCVPLSQDYHDSDDQSTTIEEKSLPREHEPVPGTNSNSSFVRQVASVVGSGYDHVDTTGIGIGTISRQPNIYYSMKDLIVPPRQLADNFLRCYWELFHAVYPVLHKPSFDAKYTELWQPFDVPASSQNNHQDAIFHSTMNIVLALGCQRNIDLTVAEREDLASEFYKRSVMLVSMDALDTSSLEIVQLLLLRGFYLLYTPYANRCWSTVGIALRVAQAVGLHLTTARVSHQLEREMHRRVWHTCVLIDWMASLSFDRPRALSMFTSPPMPEFIDDEYLSETGEGKQIQGVPSRLEFFVQGMKLLEMRRNFQEQVEKTRNRTSSGQELGVTLDLISGLDQFLEALPKHLQTEHTFFSPTSGNEDCFKLQARVLKARVMYLRLGILRQFVVAEANKCASSESEGFPLNSTMNVQNTLYRDLCTLCMSNAHNALYELHRDLSCVYRSSPWHTLYFTFAAASVIVAGTLIPYLGLQFDQNPCKASWDRAMQIFAFHKTHVASAEKGIEALQKLRNHVTTRTVRTEAVTKPVAKEVPTGNLSPIHPITFDYDSEGQTVSDSTNYFDLVPMDESWFFSQDFSFDDTIIQWQ